MMKTNSKIISILTILLIISLLIPNISFAKSIKDWFNEIRGRSIEHRATESYNQIIENRQARFCEQLVNWMVKIDQNITERQAKIQERQTERLERLEQRRENRDIRLEEHREKWEEKWEEHFDKLEDIATTSAQMEALIEFKQAVKDAIASRQAAIDEAISDFRDALDQAIANRKTAIETAKNNYLSAYQAAIDKAKADCAAGNDPAQVRETLKAALKAAREKFISDIQAVEELDLKPLVDARQQAFREALQYFKKAMQEARDKLKEALGL